MEDQKGRSKLFRNIWPFIAATFVFLLVLVAIKNPSFVEDYYSEGFYTVFARILSFFSRLLPFSLWDIFWFLAIFSLLVGIALVIRKKFKLRKLLLITGQILALLYAYFYISWGFNYFRPDIEKRIGLELQSVDEKLFRTALDSVIVMVNKSHTLIGNEDYNDIDRKVEESYSDNSSILDIKYPNGYRRPKKMIFSNLIVKFGISGYFGPFFNEINLNRRILPMEYPFLLAHEKAHQFGVSRESDANLVAFIVCTKTSDRRLNYSGYLALLLYFMEDAQYFSDYHEYLRKLDKPVLEELRFRQKYYYGLQNEVMEHAHEKVYDVYLKTNQVTSGIENYNQVVELAVSWLVRESKLSE
ncbi:MAG TPA: DUF3810 domain-containing protein [Bacteroidales bacterium]|nr:DUF3810 domain-containing protein [Bacteroidales bacterium]